MSVPLHFWSRTAREVDRRCQRERYHLTEVGGQGIVPAQTAEPLETGIDLHRGLERIHQGEDPQVVADDVFKAACPSIAERYADHPDLEVIVAERAFLLRGWMLGHARVVLPNLLSEFKIVSIEASTGWNHAPGLVFGFKPDLILERLDDGTLWYWEAKSTANTSAKWFKSWEFDLQVHLTALAYRELKGVPLAGTIIQGYAKGRKDYDTGHLSSPLIGGWMKPADPPLLPAQYALRRPQSWKGWKQVSVTDMGQDQWFDLFSPADLASEFPATAPIFLNEDLAFSALRQAEWREREIAASRLVLRDPSTPEGVKAAVVERVFPMTGKCSPSWGEPCAYLRACWEPLVADDPLGSGVFIPREPHHEVEKDLLFGTKGADESRAGTDHPDSGDPPRREG
jgi:hypothetical protein